MALCATQAFSAGFLPPLIGCWSRSCDQEGNHTSRQAHSRHWRTCQITGRKPAGVQALDSVCTQQDRFCCSCAHAHALLLRRASPVVMVNYTGLVPNHIAAIRAEHLHSQLAHIIRAVHPPIADIALASLPQRNSQDPSLQPERNCVAPKRLLRMQAVRPPSHLQLLALTPSACCRTQETSRPRLQPAVQQLQASLAGPQPDAQLVADVP
jgi:hypothetical protein